MVLAVLHAGFTQRVLEKQLYDAQADDLPADRNAQFSRAWSSRSLRWSILSVLSVQIEWPVTGRNLQMLLIGRLLARLWDKEIKRNRTLESWIVNQSSRYFESRCSVSTRMYQEFAIWLWSIERNLTCPC